MTIPNSGDVPGAASQMAARQQGPTAREADEAEARRLEQDAGNPVVVVAGLPGGHAAVRMRQAAEELRAGEPENARALLIDAPGRAVFTAHDVGPFLNEHLGWLAGRYPPLRPCPEHHAERLRRLVRDARAAGGIPQETRDRFVAEIGGAAANLAAGRPLWAWHALTRASRPDKPGDESTRETALRLRAGLEANSVRHDVYELLSQMRAAGDDRLVHLRTGETWCSVHGTGRAAWCAEEQRAAGVAVTRGEEPDTRAMPAGARDLRALALDLGWDVFYEPSHRDDRRVLSPQVTVHNPDTGETFVMDWPAEHPWRPRHPELLDSHRARIAAAPRIEAERPGTNGGARNRGRRARSTRS